MRIVHLNTSDVTGGAARAAHRIHLGLRGSGHKSYMMVQAKSSDEYHVIGPKNRIEKIKARTFPLLNNMPLWLYPNRDPSFGASFCSFLNLRDLKGMKPDIVHLHWIAGGFLRIEDLKDLGAPIVWTMHDSWPFTGGCHIPFSCTRYSYNCGRCPVLKSNRESDMSRRIWERKRKAWSGLDISMVAPSRWMADCSKRSSLFKESSVRVIPNGIDLSVYKRLGRDFARHAFNIPLDKKVILFGAMGADSDRNKGFQFLKPALSVLKQKGLEDALLVIFGASELESPPHFGFDCRYVGRLYDDVSLAALYSAVDVFVAPSLQENLANTVVESLSCGTPCVAFDIGGMPDMIDHKQNGYLAAPYEVEDLARGIEWVVSDPSRHGVLSLKAREKALKNYDIKLVSEMYLGLYRSILDSKEN